LQKWLSEVSVVVLGVLMPLAIADRGAVPMETSADAQGLPGRIGFLTMATILAEDTAAFPKSVRRVFRNFAPPGSFMHAIPIGWKTLRSWSTG